MFNLIRSHVLIGKTANTRILEFTGFSSEHESCTAIILEVQSEKSLRVEFVPFCKQITCTLQLGLNQPGKATQLAI